jgi:hypothetical protein
LVMNYLLPSYSLRFGVTERVDVGMQVPLPAGLNFKVNPIRGDFDLAVNPGYQFFLPFPQNCAPSSPPQCSGPPGMHAFRLPVQWGVNHSQNLSLIGELGPVLVDSPDHEPRVMYQAGIGGVGRLRRQAVVPLFQVMFDPAHSIPEEYANGWTWFAVLGLSVTWSTGSKRAY